MRSRFEKIKEIKKNIALLDFILLLLIYFKQKFYDILILKKVIKNWPEVMLFRFGLKKKFIAELRNGKKIKIENADDYFNFWKNFWNSEDFLILFPKDTKFNLKKQIAFKYKNHFFKLYSLNIEGMVSAYKEQFIDERHKHLNVKRKIVVDVGAYIGDTAIYFVANGAKHVYAFEPYPFSCKITMKNVKLNKLEDKITVVNEAIGEKNKIIYINEDYKNRGDDVLKEFKKGKKIKVTTLEEVVKKFKLKDAVLKMDCEGCEYPSILTSTNKILRKFKQISIEYHYGYLNLKKKLEEAGFKVRVSLSRYAYNKTQGLYMVGGILYAQRLSKARKSYANRNNRLGKIEID